MFKEKKVVSPVCNKYGFPEELEFHFKVKDIGIRMYMYLKTRWNVGRPNMKVEVEMINAKDCLLKVFARDSRMLAHACFDLGQRVPKIISEKYR